MRPWYIRIYHATRIAENQVSLACIVPARLVMLDVLSVLMFHFASPLARRPTEFKCRDVCEDVLLMHSLAKARRAKRFQSGALSLNTPKLSFRLDENGNPAEFAAYPIRDSNRLVEVGISPISTAFVGLTRKLKRK